jgi:predicted metal-binding membrane protein
MAVIAAAIAMEKLLPRGYWLSRISGGVILGAGIYTFREAAGRDKY